MTQKQKERAYRLAMYPLGEELRIGLITKEQFYERSREIFNEIYGDKK